MNRVARLICGAIAVTATIAGVALFSSWPTYRAVPAGNGLVKLSFSHGGERSCRDLTETELARLPPNMRRTKICDRKRQPVYVELDLDDETVYRALLQPSGIAGDGPSRVYQRFMLTAGEHNVAIRLRDTNRAEGFDYAATRRISLAPGQNLVIDFRPLTGGFTFN